MSKFQTTIKLAINNYQIVVHKYVLEKMPFFDDFVKSNDEEINIQCDADPDIIDQFVEILYGNYYKNFIFLDLFKVFKLADFLCFDLPKLDLGVYNYNKEKNMNNELLKYVYVKNDIDVFIKFKKSFNLKIKINDCLDIGADDDFIVKVIDGLYVSGINCLYDLGKYQLISNLLKTKKLYVSFGDGNNMRDLYVNISNDMILGNITEDKREMIRYVLFDNGRIKNWFHNVLDNLQEKYKEKFEKKS